MWIFKSFSQDFLRIFASGIFSFLIFLRLGESESFAASIFWIFIFSFANIGHVYSTFAKMYFDPNEKKFSNWYWTVPLFFVSLAILWKMFLPFVYFWVFVMYFDIYHNLKQGLGIMKWYEKINKNIHKYSSFFFYFLTIFPVVIFHFRNVNVSLLSFYTPAEPLLPVPLDPQIITLINTKILFDNIWHLYLFAIYFIGLNLIVFYEIYYSLIKKVEYNRLLSLIYFSSIYAYSFLVSRSTLEMVVLLVSSHGIPYIFLFLKRIKNIKTKFNIISLVMFFVLLGTSMDLLISPIMESKNSIFNNPTWLELVITIFYIVPSLCHFAWDGYLWKSKHPDIKGLYDL